MARRTVRLLAAARLVSAGGSQAAQLALAFSIFQRTRSATWVAAALVASAGVVGLVGPLSGWIGDRFDRRRVMVTTELAGSAGWAAMVFTRGPLAMVLVALVVTAVNAPFRAASSAAIPNLVDAEDLAWANGVIATAFNASLVVGPLVGGALVAVSGPRLVFAVNAVSFVVSAALLSISRGDFSVGREGPDEPGPLTGNAWAGFVAAWHDRVLRSLVLTTTFSFAAFGVTLVADLPLTASFHAGSIGYGLLTTLWGLGAVAGSLLAARTLTPRHEPAALALGAVAMAISIGSIAVMPTFALAVLAGTVGGVGSGYAFTPWFSLVQRATDDRIRSRVFAAAETCEQMAFVLGMLAGGGVVAAVGARTAYVVPGGLLAIGAIAAAGLHRRLSVAGKPLAGILPPAIGPSSD